MRPRPLGETVQMGETGDLASGFCVHCPHPVSPQCNRATRPPVGTYARDHAGCTTARDIDLLLAKLRGLLYPLPSCRILELFFFSHFSSFEWVGYCLHQNKNSNCSMPSKRKRTQKR